MADGANPIVIQNALEPDSIWANNGSNMSVEENMNITKNSLIHGESVPTGYSVPHIILTSILVSVIMIVIVFGNLLVVMAIYTDRTLNTTQNWFIASLAVADFLLGLVIMPFSLANEMMGYWYFGPLWCDLWKAIDVLLCTASILSICLISLDRYWSITRAITYPRQRTPTRAAMMIAAVWFLSAVICVPPLIGWKNPLPVSDYPLCLLSADIGYVLYSTMGSFYIPCVIMVFVYFKIFQAARKLARKNIRKKENMKKFKNAHPEDYITDMPEGTDSNSGHDKSNEKDLHVPQQDSKDIPKKNLKITNEQTKLIVTDSDTDSCKILKQETDAKSVNNKSADVNDTVVHVTCTLQLNGKLHDEHKECIESISTDGNETHVSNEPTSEEFKPPENRSSLERASNKIHMRKFSETFSKKRSRSNSNKASKGWRTSSLREHERQKRKIAKARERRATIVLGLVMAAFILCWFPFFTLYIITSFCYCIGDIVFAVVFWAGYCNSALNPIIYTIFNRDFRHAFHKIIFGKFRQCR